MQRRPVEAVVVSDIHLGTFACRAQELLTYLQSIAPQILILNGDILDGWQFSKHYFPPHHVAVIQEIFGLISSGTRVIYITGNHDDALRKYSDLQLGNFQLTDKAVIEINGKMTWVFHGDVFDHTTKNQAKFWNKLGSNGYALLLGFNKLMTRAMKLIGREPVSLSKSVMKQFHKRFVKIDQFETKIGEIAIDKKYDCVICGHIHQPKKRVITNERGSVTYLNSGDWVEHMTSLEFYENDWHMYTHHASVSPSRVKTQLRQDANMIPDDVFIHLHSLKYQ